MNPDDAHGSRFRGPHCREPRSRRHDGPAVPHLREEKGYTYGIGSSVSSLQYRGDWSAPTSVRTAVTEAALTELLAEVAAMREKPVPASEFEDAKRAIQASFALSIGSPAAILNYFVQSWTYLRAAGRLLGHVSREDRIRHPRAGADGGTQVLGSRSPPHRRGRRRAGDCGSAGKKGTLGDVRC